MKVIIFISLITLSACSWKVGKISVENTEYHFLDGFNQPLQPTAAQTIKEEVRQ